MNVSRGRPKRLKKDDFRVALASAVESTSVAKAPEENDFTEALKYGRQFGILWGPIADVTNHPMLCAITALARMDADGPLTAAGLLLAKVQIHRAWKWYKGQFKPRLVQQSN